MAVERSLILIKPDAMQRRLAGEILGRIERRGFTLRAGKLIHVERELAEKHYAEHAQKPFFGELVEFIGRSPAMLMVLEGPEDTWKVVRTMMGVTNPRESAPGTIRGDFAISVQNNLVHGSDSPENASTEIALWFKKEELVNYGPVDAPWVG